MINKDKSVALYQAIANSDEEREFKFWHASSIYMCPKAHYLKRRGQKRLTEPSAAKVLRWQAGHHIETSLRDAIKAVYGELTSNERMTSEKLQLTGEFDNLTYRGDTLIEVKSVHDYAFIERNGQLSLKHDTGKIGPRGGRQYDIKQTPYLHHEWQNHAYVLLLEEKGVNVKNIDYVYSSLSGRLVVYSTKVQPEILEALRERLTLLNEAWKAQKAPECICTDTTSPFYDLSYKWCDFRRNTTGTCCEEE